METVESSENMALLIVIALIAILGFCIIDSIFYKIFKRKPKKKKKEIKKEVSTIDKQLAEIEELENKEKSL